MNAGEGDTESQAAPVGIVDGDWHAAGRVIAVASDPDHGFSKPLKESITLVAGHGVEGDAHFGRTVQHRSRVARDPTQPNLRQVHLLSSELLAPLVERGFAVAPGRLGENVTTEGIDLPNLPRGARLRLGRESVIEITGLRNPCHQLDEFGKGLVAAVLDRAPDGRLVRKAGVMAVVLEGGVVRAGDPVAVRWPAPPHEPLDRV